MSINALLIEDDSDLAEAIADYMELDGVEFDFAYNGAAGLNLALEGQYDIILTDINMPKMDGLDVCQSLRQQGVTTPILMLTARDTLQDKIAGFEVGSDDLFSEAFCNGRAKSTAHGASASFSRFGDFSVGGGSQTGLGQAPSC